MRRLSAFLLLLNLLVLLAGLALERWSAAPSRPLTFNADKIELLPPTPPSDFADEIGGAEPATDTAAEAGAEISAACLSWRNLDADGLRVIEDRLMQAGIAVGSYDFRLDRRLGWWVYLPPFQDAAALQGAMEDARSRGVSDLAAVRGGGMANAVSLGAFPYLAKARAHAAALANKGIKGVRFGPRPDTGEIRLLLSGDVTAASASALATATWPAGLVPARCQLQE